MATVIPVLRIFDTGKAREFYNDWLDFKVDWKHQFEEGAPFYIQISRDDIILHLTEHHGDCTPGSKVFIEISRIKEFCAELNAKNYRFNKPAVEQAPWNGLMMQLVDPFGNRLLFNESPAG